MGLRIDQARINANHNIFARLGLLDRVDGRGRKFDANETLYLSRQLEEIKAELVETEFDELRLPEFIPFKQAARGAQSYTWRELTAVGVAELINLATTDLPSVAAWTKENTSKFHDVGISYGYNDRDLEAAAFADQPLDPLLGRIAKEAHLLVRERAGVTGLSEVNTKGLANTTGVPLIASGLTGDWLDAGTSSQEILDDMAAMLYTPFVSTRQRHMANTILLPTAAWIKFTTAFYSSTTPRTLRSIFAEAFPGANVGTYGALDTAGASSKPRAVIYKKAPTNLEFIYQIEFEQKAPQEKDFTYHIPCRSAFLGVVVYRPLTMAYTDLLVDP